MATVSLYPNRDALKVLPLEPPSLQHILELMAFRFIARGINFVVLKS